jgi:Xaa-Pro aminopeptidase
MALSLEERARRYAAVRAEMAARDIDVLVVVGRDSSNERGNHRYLTGYGVAAAFAHYVVLARDADVDPIVFSGSSPSALLGEARGWVTDLRKSRTPQEEIVAEVGRLRGGGRIGIVDSLPIPVYRALVARHGEDAIADATDCLRMPRLRKSAEEIALMRRSADLADVAYRHLRDVVAPGRTDWEVYAELKRVLHASGSEYSMDIIECGDGAASVPVGHTIGDDDTVHVEITPSWDGYYTQLRVAFPVRDDAWTNGLARVHEGWKAAYGAAAEALAPGVTAAAVYERAAAALSEAGLAMGHRAGHGLGLDVDEFVSLSPGDDTVLEPGMTVVVHPRVTHEGRHLMMGGTFVVTDDGREALAQGAFD